MTTSEAPHSYQLVAFDLGGVFVRISHSWEEAARAAGVLIKLGEKTDLYAYAGLEQYQAGILTLEDYKTGLGQYLSCTPEEALLIHNGILIEPYPGTEELVSDIKAAGVLTGCLSNTNEAHWTELVSARFPVIEQLDFQMASHLVGLNKPDPAIYALFAKTCGVEPRRAVFFDDHPGNVASANEAGFKAFQIDPKGDTAAQMRSILQDLRILSPK